MKEYLNENLSNEERIMNLVNEYGWINGSHHKQWIIDQIMRITMGCPVITENYISNDEKQIYSMTFIGTNAIYNMWCKDEDGNYAWDEGIAP